jgi:hypothetical protein
MFARFFAAILMEGLKPLIFDRKGCKIKMEIAQLGRRIGDGLLPEHRTNEAFAAL